MKNLLHLAAALTLAILMSAPANAVQNTDQNGRMTTQGRITSMMREGKQYRVSLDNGGSSYYVPMNVAQSNHLTGA